jgi:hypothetical protein
MKQNALRKMKAAVAARAGLVTVTVRVPDDVYRAMKNDNHKRSLSGRPPLDWSRVFADAVNARLGRDTADSPSP